MHNTCTATNVSGSLLPLSGWSTGMHLQNTRLSAISKQTSLVMGNLKDTPEGLMA